MKKLLSRSDEILLLAIFRIKENAYGVTIRKEVQMRSGKKLTFGGLWVSLDILCHKGLLVKTIADSTPERGGRGKIYYKLTKEGLKELEKIRDLQESLWKDLPEKLKIEKN